MNEAATAYQVQVDCDVCGRCVTGQPHTTPTAKGELRSYRMRWVTSHGRHCPGKVTVREVQIVAA